MALRCTRGAPVGTPEAVLEENAQHLEIDQLAQAVVDTIGERRLRSLDRGVPSGVPEESGRACGPALPELLEELEALRQREIAKHEIGLVCQDLCEADLPVGCSVDCIAQFSQPDGENAPDHLIIIDAQDRRTYASSRRGASHLLPRSPGWHGRGSRARGSTRQSVNSNSSLKACMPDRRRPSALEDGARLVIRAWRVQQHGPAAYLVMNSG